MRVGVICSLLLLSAACTATGDTADPTGTAVITLVHEPGIGPEIAELLVPVVLERNDFEAEQVDETTLVITIGDITEADAATLGAAADIDPVELRPVVEPDRCAADVQDDEVQLVPARRDGDLCLGAVAATAEVFERGSAAPIENLGWVVVVDLTATGLAAWNSIAAECFAGTPNCPASPPGGHSRLAIVLDGEVVSAPTVNQPRFAGSVQISGDFTRAEATEFAQVLNRGAFPARLEVIGVEWSSD